MERSWPGLSLRWKLILGSVLIEVVMLTMLVTNSIRLIEASLEDQVELRVRELSVLLNASIAPAMAELDYGPIHGVFSESRRKEGIVYFVLFDRNGKLVARDGWASNVPLPAIQPRIDIKASVRRLDTEIPIGIGGQTYGRLQFGISTEFLHQAREKLVRQSIVIAAIEILLSIILLVLLGLWLTRHLAKLEAASLAVAKGDFDVSVSVDSDDEVGRVGQAFNRMTQEIKHKLSALAVSEARFRSLTELSADWYWEQDVEFRFTGFQGGAMGRREQLEKELLGKRRWEVGNLRISPDGWIQHKTLLNARLPFRDLEYEYVTGKGVTLFVSVSGTPTYDATGAFSGYRGIAKDITQRKQVELALVRSERLLRLSQQAAHIGSYVIDLASGRWESSPLLDAVLGIDKNFNRDLAGWRSLLHADDRARVLDDFQATVSGGRAFSREYRIVRPTDGKTRWVVAWGDYEHDSAGKAVQQVGAMQDITERKEAAEEIEYLAFYDPLTRLPNRRLLQDRLQHALTNCARRKCHAAVMLFDMDDFKTLNDTLGHDVGDQFLREVASRMLSCIREGDTVARLGGDEFVVILEDLDEDTLAAVQAEAVAVKIQAALDRAYQLDVSSPGGPQATRGYHCTSSIGITLFCDASVSVDELMKRADTAMYQAKAAGRNTLRFFDPEMQAAVSARATLDADLREAIDNEQFVLHYQPQINHEGRVTGAEGLVRWRHPERGMVAPDSFIPAAEDSGLILPIGHWVLKTACRQLVAWAARAETEHLSLAINVSARQFRHRDFVEQVLLLLAETGANPRRLKLELTESLLVEDLDVMRARMAALKAHGVGFSLDDFGTGYSSLSYLKLLPLDQLKIDRSFVRDVLTDPNDAAIARTIVALAQSLGLSVIAEGVETAAQRDFLETSGCRFYQGYHFSRPLAIEGFEEFVRGV